ncbi:MAG: hypothetical protein CSB13_10585 [Chloroflexi bacterium]|nr:MAG: hypothetical protein CSB13_10585 [Chloroflexota bacterium]
MDYLVRTHLHKVHPIAHYVHERNGRVGALCSPKPTPAVGERTQSGEWGLVDALPPHVKVCLVCQKRKAKLEDPLPERVKKELERLAWWDPRAAAIQRQKALAHYRKQLLSK